MRRGILQGLAAKAVNLTRTKGHPEAMLERLDPPVPPNVEVGDYRSAVRAMVDRKLLQSSQYQTQQWRADRTRSHPDILLFEMLLVRRMAQLGVPMFTHAVYRDAANQNALHEAGHSRATAGQSPHNYGLAADIVHSRLGWNLSERSWAVVGHIGKELAATLRVHDSFYTEIDPVTGVEITRERTKPLRIIWGGDWSFYDPAHWELQDWKSLKDWQF